MARRVGRAGGQAGQLGDAKAGRQGLEPGAVQQDVQAGLIDPQKVMVLPARAGPSQTCWLPSCKFPDGGTIRSTSTATRKRSGPASAVTAGSATVNGMAVCSGWARPCQAGTRSVRDGPPRSRHGDPLHGLQGSGP